MYRVCSEAEDKPMIPILRWTAFVLALLALVPAGAHFFSLWSKMRLNGADYLAAQRAYDGWALFGVVVIGALVATLALAVALWAAGRPFGAAALAFLCIAATQVLFWSLVFPANQATANWTMLPEGWQALRAQWEYAHAASAVLNFAAVLLLAVR
jgi:hypothetical protein